MTARAPQLLLVFVLSVGAFAAGVLRPSRAREADHSARVPRVGAGTGLAVPVIVLPARQAAAAPTVRMEKRDRSWGQVIAIVGSGWEPGETVCLVVHEASSKNPDALFFATADSSGNIFNDQFSPDLDSAAKTFALTARGQSSELQAQTRSAYRRAGSGAKGTSPRTVHSTDTSAKSGVPVSYKASSRS